LGADIWKGLLTSRNIPIIMIDQLTQQVSHEEGELKSQKNDRSPRHRVWSNFGSFCRILCGGEGTLRTVSSLGSIDQYCRCAQKPPARSLGARK